MEQVKESGREKNCKVDDLITVKSQEQDQNSRQEAQQCEGPPHLELRWELHLPGKH